MCLWMDVFVDLCFCGFVLLWIYGNMELCIRVFP